MNFNELQNKWQSQNGDEKLLSINSEMLLQDAKSKMHKFENFTSFSFKYFLVLIVPLAIINYITQFITMGTVLFSEGELYFELPVILFTFYWYYITNIKKYNSDNYTFVKASIYKIKGGWIKYIFIAYFLVYWFLINDFEKFFSVITKTPTVLYLTILMWLLMISYGIYFYLTMIRPTLKQLNQLKKLYEENE